MKIVRTWALVLMGSLASVLPATAQTLEHFLQITGIEGESGDARHRGWIDLSSWSWGVHQGLDANGKPVARFDPLAWQQGVDSSVVPLFLGVANGTRFEQATLDVSRPVEGGGVFFQMVFNNVQPISLVIANGSDVAAALQYDAVTMRYDDGRGWIEGHFDIGPQGLVFRGDANVLTGLFLAGGDVALDVVALPPVPEPGTFALWAAGLGMVAAVRRGRRRA